ncbi:hypothetical protein E2K98_29635 [Bacillus salipaludis]|uniref:GNAT family N-acetyltransferase n=1 Tax=Bacillus salipaludis TaxID=2547811 RepID=A0A4R5VJF8_9BACI|nr:GNAT family N-acetyltransferase [Bacillus salipaludis]MDQ6598024.1 GNAT family N-acetyltransferase [Bacillus salipaludis]TDK54192.1 hypothetical protein E2K98_29635 [Bacillus salipaludis]
MEKEIAASILKSNLPENVMLAEVDNRLVGISIANERVKGIEMYNSFTGTMEEMRGKGIAFGLKLQVIKNNIKHGYSRMRANNSSINQPMLAINEKLGFVRQPGKWILTKSLD